MLSSQQISAMLAHQQQVQYQRQQAAQQLGFRYSSNRFHGSGTDPGLIGATALGKGGLGIAGMASSFIPGLNPVGTAISGARAGFAAGGYGLGAMGAVAGAVPGLAFGAAVDWSGRQIHQGAVQQAGFQNTLNAQFGGFINPSSGNAGRGFNRVEGGAISSSLSGLTDAFTGMGDIHRIVQKMGQMGFGTSATDIQRFSREMKRSIGAVKEIAVMLNTTMDEAMPMFGAARRMGIYGRADILRNAMNRGSMRTVGFSAEQSNQVGMMGAQISNAYGARRGAGAQAMQHAAGMVGAAAQAGALSEEDLMEASGGQTGPEAYSTIAGSLMQGAWRRSRGPIGRSLIAAAMQKGKDGKLSLNKDTLRRYASGKMGLSELSGMVGKGLRTAGGRVGFMANERRLAGEMMQTIGPEFAIRSALRGFKPEEQTDNMIRVLLQRNTRFNQGQVEVALKMIRRMDDVHARNSSNIRREVEARYRESSQKMDHSFSSFMRKLEHSTLGGARGTLKKFGADLQIGIATGYEEASDRFWGKYSHVVGEDDLSATRQDLFLNSGRFSGKRGSGSLTGNSNYNRGSRLGNEMMRKRSSSGGVTTSMISRFSRDLALRGEDPELSWLMTAVQKGGGGLISSPERQDAIRGNAARKALARMGVGRDYGVDLNAMSTEEVTGLASSLMGKEAGFGFGDRYRGAKKAALDVQDANLSASQQLNNRGSWLSGALYGGGVLFAPVTSGLSTIAAGSLEVAIKGTTLGQTFLHGSNIKTLEGTRTKQLRAVRRALKDPEKRRFLLAAKQNPGHPQRDQWLRDAGVTGNAVPLIDSLNIGATADERDQQISEALDAVVASREQASVTTLDLRARRAGRVLMDRLEGVSDTLGADLAGSFRSIGSELEELSGGLAGRDFADQRSEILGKLRGLSRGRKKRALAALRSGALGAVGIGAAEAHRIDDMKAGKLTGAKTFRQLYSRLGLSTSDVGKGTELGDHLRGVFQGGVTSEEAADLKKKAIASAFARGIGGGINATMGLNESMTIVAKRLEAALSPNGYLKVQDISDTLTSDGRPQSSANDPSASRTQAEGNKPEK